MKTSGGGGGGASAQTSGPIIANNGTVILGHSFAYYENLTSAGDVSATSGGVSTRSFTEWCSSRLRAGGMNGYEVLTNLGVGSQTIEQVIALQLANALAAPGDVAKLIIGVNNLNSGLANPDPLPTIMAQYRSLITSLAAGKKVVVVYNVSPVTVTGGSGAVPRNMQFELVNIALKTLCAGFANVLYVNVYDSWIDPASARLNPLASMAQTDGIHPSGFGAQTFGYAEAKALADKFTLTPYYTMGSNLAPSPGLSGSGGTALNTSGSATFVGTIPTGWTCELVSGQCTITSTTNGTVGPDVYQMSLSAVTASVVKFYPTNGAALAALFPNATDKIIAGFGISQQQVSGAVKWEPCIIIDAFTWHGLQQASDEVGPVFPTKDMSGNFRTRAMTLTSKAPATSIQPCITVTLPASGFVKVGVFQPELFKPI